MVQEVAGKETIETPSLEKQVEDLKSRLEVAETELTQTKKGLSTAHQTLTEKDKELKKRAQVEDDIALIKDQLELVASAVSERLNQSDEDSSPKVDVLARLKKDRETKEQQRKQQEFAQVIDQYRLRTEALKLDPESEDYLDIQDLATRGNFKLADIRLKKLEVRQVEKDAEVAKTQKVSQEDDDKRIEERARKILQEKGLLKTDSGTPAGGGGGKTWTRSQVNAMSVAEYRQAFPNYADYLQAQSEGRIK